MLRRSLLALKILRSVLATHALLTGLTLRVALWLLLLRRLLLVG